MIFIDHSIFGLIKTPPPPIVSYIEVAPPQPSTNPCVPSPCGPNSQCRVVGDETAVCSCVANHIGRPPYCRPECTLNAECPGNLACINERCKDPCQGACGPYTTCSVSAHQPICRCLAQYTGDPFSSCSPIPSKPDVVWY